MMLTPLRMTLCAYASLTQSNQTLRIHRLTADTRLYGFNKCFIHVRIFMKFSMDFMPHMIASESFSVISCHNVTVA
jgi:hypothetical protein